jgi:tricorn protease
MPFGDGCQLGTSHRLAVGREQREPLVDQSPGGAEFPDTAIPALDGITAVLNEARWDTSLLAEKLELFEGDITSSISLRALLLPGGRPEDKVRFPKQAGVPVDVNVSVKSNGLNPKGVLLMCNCRALLLILVAAPSPAAAQPGYYRQPALHGDTVVFVAEGDLWSVPLSGGSATRLTTHPAAEGHPAISPSGKRVAFTARYEGPTEVYVMPRTGGRPRRLTFDAANISYVGWTPDGRVLVGTNVHAGLPAQQLVALDCSSRDGVVTRTRIPLTQAAEGSYTPDGKTLVFTRQAFQGSHTKRYKGGTAQQLWSFREGDAEAKPLTADYPGTSKAPMPWQGRIYFASDRDGTMNLWSIKPDGSQPQQHTKHHGFDIASPALDAGRIVYQRGAELRVYDIAKDSDKPIPIVLDSDFDQTREKWIKEPIEYMSDAHPSPDGSKVAVTARGRVFVIPQKHGRLVEAGRKLGVRYRDARFMPDGKTLLALSDESGEVELWTLPADGLGDPIQRTTDAAVLREKAIPSPDGNSVAHTDKNLHLFLLDVKTKENKLLAESTVAEFEDLTWSPDSKWLAFAEMGENQFRRVKLYSVATGKITPVTTDRFDSFAPAFSPDGKWLYFLSDRNLKSVVASPWGTYQPEPFLDKRTKIYQIPLTPGLRSPFTPPTEVDLAEKEEQKKDGKKERPKVPTVTIDLEGIAARLIPVPVPPGNYRSLAVTEKALFWVSSQAGETKNATLQTIPINHDEPEVKRVAEKVTGFELSADRKKLLLLREKEQLLVDVASDKLDETKAKVNLAHWIFAVDPREEWRQMFVEAWRLERDYFYDRGMHGVDWPAMRKKYEPLLARVTDREELDDLISQMVSELSALHIFVRPGDLRKGPENITPARLGAALVRDAKAGGYRIERIYRHEPDEPQRASPLARPGVHVKAGDTIVTVDGSPALLATDLGALLRGKAGRQVLLGVKPAQGELRKLVVKPLSPKDEDDLRYHEWEYTRRLMVDEQGGGNIGYVHLRAMGGRDFESWAKGYYPAFAKGGLIIDVRNNRGGNIDSWIISRLLRKAWFYWNQRVGRANLWNMQYAFRGHVVVLCNEWTASDGEAFCEGVKRLKLGTVLGTRTWGGEIWLDASNGLVDKGIATSAEFGVFDKGGSWLIEGHGVEPDVVVDNLPHTTFQGKDDQLTAAVKLLNKKLRDQPIALPPVPPFPRKAVAK